MRGQRLRLEQHSHEARIAWSYGKLEDAKAHSALEPLEGAQPCGHLDWGPWPSEW